MTNCRLTLTLYRIPIKTRSHCGTREIISYCHIYHSHQHKFPRTSQKILFFSCTINFLMMLFFKIFQALVSFSFVVFLKTNSTIFNHKPKAQSLKVQKKIARTEEIKGELSYCFLRPNTTKALEKLN